MRRANPARTRSVRRHTTPRAASARGNERSRLSAQSASTSTSVTVTAEVLGSDAIAAGKSGEGEEQAKQTSTSGSLLCYLRSDGTAAAFATLRGGVRSHDSVIIGVRPPADNRKHAVW